MNHSKTDQKHGLLNKYSFCLQFLFIPFYQSNRAEFNYMMKHEQLKVGVTDRMMHRYNSLPKSTKAMYPCTMTSVGRYLRRFNAALRTKQVEGIPIVWLDVKSSQKGSSDMGAVCLIWFVVLVLQAIAGCSG